MNRLVSYIETSSDEEETSKPDQSECEDFSSNEQDVLSTTDHEREFHIETYRCRSRSRTEAEINDPVTDESDIDHHRREASSSDSEFYQNINEVPVVSQTKCINFLSATFSSNESESDDNRTAYANCTCFNTPKGIRHKTVTNDQTTISTKVDNKCVTCVCRSKPSVRQKYPSIPSVNPAIESVQGVNPCCLKIGGDFNCNESCPCNMSGSTNQYPAPDNLKSLMADSQPSLPCEPEMLSSERTQRKRKLTHDSGKDKRLCVPEAISNMYEHKQNRWVDNPALHENRVRTFQHMEGNWATFVHIPVKNDKRFIKFVEELLRFFYPLHFQALPDFHVSLSRTVTIRHHWIEPLIESLRENLRHQKSCISDMTSVKLFTNDERTRTFVCIELSQDDVEFLDYVKAVNKSFAEFKLPDYYENPSFHISIGWCLGDVINTVSQEKLRGAKQMLGEFIAANPDLSVVYAQQIFCQTGNKTFVLSLTD